VVSSSGDVDSDLRAVAAGAADYVSLTDLTADRFQRTIRHALLRQQGIVRTRQEVEALTTEKTRLNLLRDANHRFVENACHDFRSPLTVIKEFAAIIAEGLAGDVNEEQSEFLQIILTRVDHLSHMVDGILDASRLESDLIGVRREEQPVRKLVEHARSTLEQRAAAHKVSIEFAIPEGLPHVFADVESIGRVIVNLGANACKYARENGKILVWARYNAKDRDVTIGVTDNGPGIAPEHVKLIFDRFQQLPKDKAEQKDGFGLGLHISSELVRVNFGTLTVESEPQKGSTFAFTLPVFDVNSLIPLHFAFLRTARHSFQKVSIAVAASVGDADSAMLAEVERSLHRQLRSYDLLLRLREGNWLVCAAGDSAELTKITERILGTYAEISRNRPEGRLPEMRFRPIGSWPLASRPDGLTDAIRGAYALAPGGREIH
jgi:signal transduction histidine kinase